MNPVGLLIFAVRQRLPRWVLPALFFAAMILLFMVSFGPGTFGFMLGAAIVVGPVLLVALLMLTTRPGQEADDA